PRRNCMPRGRKRPPQDSVDSILLAISRRDNIDPDTLSHYFDRLDEEWTDGARDKVLHLLRTNDAAAHAAAILILSELATEFDLEDILSMPLERRLGFINWLGNSHDPRASNLLIPLLENQTSKIVIAVIDALEQLGEIASDQTIPALNYLITHTANRQVKQYA